MFWYVFHLVHFGWARLMDITIAEFVLFITCDTLVSSWLCILNVKVMDKV